MWGQTMPFGTVASYRPVAHLLDDDDRVGRSGGMINYRRNVISLDKACPLSFCFP
jgi:hypothetical protein